MARPVVVGITLRPVAAENERLLVNRAYSDSLERAGADVLERGRDHADDFRAGSKRGIGDQPHQPDTAAAINQFSAGATDRRSQHCRGFAIGRLGRHR